MTEPATKRRKLNPDLYSKIKSFGEKHGGCFTARAKKDFQQLLAFAKPVEGETKEDSRPEETDVGELICTFPCVKCISPRSKMAIYFHENAILLQSKSKGPDSEKFTIMHDDINELIILEDQAERKGTYICLPLDEPMAYGKRKVQIILMELDSEEEVSGIEVKTKVEGLSKTIEGNLVEQLRLVLEKTTERMMETTDDGVFEAHDGSNHIKCCVGAKQGSLYPLPCGILFIVSPLKYFPKKKIHEVAGDMSVGTKTFDFAVYDVDADKAFTFSMVPRQEQDALTNYRRAMKIDAAKVLQKNEDLESEDDEEENDGGDSDFDFGAELKASKNDLARDHQDLKKTGDIDFTKAMDVDELKFTEKIKKGVPVVAGSEDEGSGDETD